MKTYKIEGYQSIINLDAICEIWWKRWKHCSEGAIRYPIRNYFRKMVGKPELRTRRTKGEWYWCFKPSICIDFGSERPKVYEMKSNAQAKRIHNDIVQILRSRHDIGVCKYKG